jgi:hypothetical protein
VHVDNVKVCVGAGAGLPDCLFSYKKSKFGYILKVLGMENVGICMTIWNIYGHLAYFMAIWYNLCSVGIFFPFCYVWTKKNPATLGEGAL